MELARQFTRTVIRGSTNTISAPSPQTVGGAQYVFASWSDGGAQSHNITANTSTTFTASFNGPPRNDARPTISGEARVGRTLTANEGSWSGPGSITFVYRWLRCDKSGGSCCDLWGDCQDVRADVY